MDKQNRTKKSEEKIDKLCYDSSVPKNAPSSHDRRIQSLVRLIARRAAEADYTELLAALSAGNDLTDGADFRMFNEEKAD